MPFYADSVLDEVRNSVNIVSLVSEYVALKKRGRNHVARCPFHNEKTPSFNVSEEKQIFMCFGCGVGGDIFKFIMQEFAAHIVVKVPLFYCLFCGFG